MLVVLLEAGGNLRGMYVTLAAGLVIGIQLIISLAKLKKLV